MNLGASLLNKVNKSQLQLVSFLLLQLAPMFPDML